MAIIPKPPFPNVPKLPGVPQLVRSAASPANPGPIFGTAAALGSLWRSLFSRPQWGVFKQAAAPATNPTDDIPTVVVRGNLQPVILPDSILDFGYRNESDILQYPVQNGGFTSVNKVANPYETYVRLVKGGSVNDRAEFLQAIERIIVTTDLYQILTPERTYVNVNPYRFELVREGGRDAYQLTKVDLYFQEIRYTTQQYTQTATSTVNAKNPSAEPVTNNGTVLGTRPDPAPTLTGVVNQ